MTYSAEVPQPSAPPGLQAQPVTARVVGGAQEAALSLAQPGQGFDLAPLEQLGTKAFAALVKRQEEAEFYKGMARAAAGEAAADIEAERPAWASAFGDSDAVNGARYQEQITDAAALETRVMQAMPETRKLPPEEFAAVLQRNVESLKTGDPTRDLILTASAAQFLPGAMKAHARAYMDWQQKEAAARHEQTITEVVNALEVTDEVFRQNPNATDDETMSGAQNRAAQLLFVPPGADAEAHLGRVVQGVQAAVADGKFAMYYTLKDMGLIDKLPQAQRDTLIRSARVAERQYIQEKAPSDAVIADFRITNDPTLDGPELLAAVDKLNKQVAAVTGVRGDYITKGERDNLLQLREQWRQGAAGKAATANASAAERAAKQEAEKLQVERGVKVLASPTATVAEGIEVFSAMSKPQADLTRAGLWSSPKALPPAQRMQEYIRLSNVTGGGLAEVPDFVYAEVANAAQSTKWTPELDIWAGSVAGMNKEFAAKLQGSEKNVDLLLKYTEIRTLDAQMAAESGKPSTRTPQDMWDSAQLAVRQGRARDPLSKEAETSVQEAVQTMNTNSWVGIRSETLFGVKTEIGMAALVPLARRAYLDNAGAYNSQETRTATAVSAIRQQGGRTVAGVGFIKMNKDDPEWNDPKYFPGAANSPAKAALVGKGFRDEFDRQAARNKFFKPENIVAITQGEVDGKVEFRAVYNWVDDKTGQLGQGGFTITQAAIQSGFASLQKKMDEATARKIGRNVADMSDEEYEARLSKLRPSAR